jgi:DNA-binding response OmpR family regulator
MRILLIEDERKLAGAIAEGLQGNGYQCTAVHEGEPGLRMLHTTDFDLLLLDLMLPGQSGLEILNTLRGEGYKLPVLILTSRDAVEDRVVGLDAGADDYLVKPFAFPELLARIRALLRRNKPDPSTPLQFADLILDLKSKTASRAGSALDLTNREFDLLEYFLLNRETVVSREMLARDVWHEMARYSSLDNVIDVQMARIRRKIDDPFSFKLLHTVRGVGYILREGTEEK